MRTRRTQAPLAPTIRYTFKEGPVTIKNAKTADPQRIGESLAEIAAASEGHLTPHATVDAARDPRHQLHGFFEWDDQLAAESFRLDQARSLIRSLCVVDDEREQDPPAFFSISEGKNGTSYRPVQDVLGSVDLQNSVLKAAERDLRAFEARYARLEEICAIIREAREKITARRTTRSEDRPSA